MVKRISKIRDLAGELVLGPGGKARTPSASQYCFKELSAFRLASEPQPVNPNRKSKKKNLPRPSSAGQKANMEQIKRAAAERHRKQRAQSVTEAQKKIHRQDLTDLGKLFSDGRVDLLEERVKWAVEKKRQDLQAVAESYLKRMKTASFLLYDGCQMEIAVEGQSKKIYTLHIDNDEVWLTAGGSKPNSIAFSDDEIVAIGKYILRISVLVHDAL